MKFMSGIKLGKKLAEGKTKIVYACKQTYINLYEKIIGEKSNL